MYTATAGTDTWMARFGIDVEEVASATRSARRAGGSGGGAPRPALARGNCRAVHDDGRLLTPELLERQLQMYIGMTDLIRDLRLDFTGIKGQPEL